MLGSGGEGVSRGTWTKEEAGCSPRGVRADFSEEVIPEGGLQSEKVRMQPLS